jgi:hypothetical protein
MVGEDSLASVLSLFISYRRSDAPEVVARIYDRLARRFGKARVFKDVHSIRGGMDFQTAVSEALSRSNVLIAVIGPEWFTLRDEGGRRRIEAPDDPVRYEIKTALERGIKVVPALVGGTKMPIDLPHEVSALRYLQAVEILRDPYFETSINALLDAIRPRTHRRRLATIGFIALLPIAAATIATGLGRQPGAGGGADTNAPASTLLRLQRHVELLLAESEPLRRAATPEATRNRLLASFVSTRRELMGLDLTETPTMFEKERLLAEVELAAARLASLDQRRAFAMAAGDSCDRALDLLATLARELNSTEQAKGEIQTLNLDSLCFRFALGEPLADSIRYYWAAIDKGYRRTHPPQDETTRSVLRNCGLADPDDEPLKKEAR